MKTMKMLVALGLTAGSVAMAGSVGGSFNATANVAGTCQLTTAPTDLAFGNYDVYATGATTANTTFAVKCAKGTSYTMKLSGGDGNGVRTFATAPSGGTLKYSLSFNGTGTAWGDGASGHAAAQTVTAGNASAATYTINGSIAPGQDTAAVGAYSDSVTLSIDY